MAKKAKGKGKGKGKGKKGVSETKKITPQDNSKYFDMLKDYTGGSSVYDVYRKLDTNDSGILGRGDWQQARLGMKKRKSFSAEEFEKMWSDMDSDGGGQVDFNEILFAFGKI